MYLEDERWTFSHTPGGLHVVIDIMHPELCYPGLWSWSGPPLLTHKRLPPPFFVGNWPGGGGGEVGVGSSLGRVRLIQIAVNSILKVRLARGSARRVGLGKTLNGGPGSGTLGAKIGRFLGNLSLRL